MERILDQINSPSDLKKISKPELPRLAREIREEIIAVVSKNGGHLSSNLGATDLAIALHYVFDTPTDKIVWDVGHQSYAHKLLTGRRRDFHSLRQFQGISGFPKREESPYDVVTTGHSGTSISAALGLARARDLKGEKHKVVAVIGDGSMTAGLAYEGLNNAGGLKTDLIVVLNDNEMSISKNVGAMAYYLSHIITGQFYLRFRQESDALLRSLPGGISVLRWAKKVEEHLKGLITSGILFEELGFRYFGPIDGHKLSRLITTFQNVKSLRTPILVHVTTKKGKGYLPAEKNPSSFHGIGAFDPQCGEAIRSNSVPTFTSVFGKTITRLASEDEKVLAITAAMPEGTGLIEFSRRFPQRFFDVGIAEQHSVSFASTMALEGFKPVVAIYSTFLQRSYDQILHDLCLMKAPVTLVLDRAGLVGEDGPTHHGAFDISYLRHMPNMLLMSPKDENELQHMLKTAIEYRGPAALRFPRGHGFGVPLDSEPEILPIGKAEVLSEGEDLVMIAIGHMVHPTYKASQRLKEEGIRAAVVNARFIKPLDIELISQLVLKCGRLLTVEENVLQAGFGSAILEMLEAQGISGIECKRIGLPDAFICHGAVGTLRKVYGLDEDGIYTAARILMGKKKEKPSPFLHEEDNFSPLIANHFFEKTRTH